MELQRTRQKLGKIFGAGTPRWKPRTWGIGGGALNDLWFKGVIAGWLDGTPYGRRLGIGWVRSPQVTHSTPSALTIHTSSDGLQNQHLPVRPCLRAR
jgi:hypothetical protein